jgi:16S rRNA (guanine1207-N2)-methyltransferase
VLASNISDDVFLAEVAAGSGALTVFHRNWSALQDLTRQLGRAGNVIVSDQVFPPGGEVYDVAFVQIPKGRGLARSMLFTALRSLREGAFLYGVGPNAGGARAAQIDMEALAETQTLGTKARHRIFRACRGADPIAPKEWGTPWRHEARTFTIRGKPYTVHTQPGVFSWDHLDDGTAFLCDVLFEQDFRRGLKVLDAACGYGILGMVAERELSPEQTVWSDVDLLALSCVRASLPDKTVVPADLAHGPLRDHGPFDLILCNPPFHQEHEKDTGFMQAFAGHAGRMLSRHGQLALVANRFLPYRMVLKAHFREVVPLAENGRYRVITCRV